MLSLSGHKLHGPKGIGALYLRKGTPFSPLLRGGPQERRRRGGTENVPAIIGLGNAAELALTQMQDDQTRIRALRDRLERGVLHVGDCSVLGDVENRLPNTLNIAFEHLEGEAIIHHLNRAGIAASLGSACASGSMEPSHVLRAMNVPATALRGAIRFSLSRDNTIDEVVRVLNVLPEIVARLRASSPSWQARAPVTANPSRSSELTL
jgi:cysteine desulfurase